jgi:sn-glycerol 3-phosphate transport system substrate-binding protein
MTPITPQRPGDGFRSWSPSRRQVLAVGAVAMTIPLLAGCSSPAAVYSQPKGKVPDEYAKRQRVVIWSPFGGANGEILAGLVDGFNTSQKEIYAEIQQFDGYDGTEAKLAAGLQAKQVPDVVILGDVSWNRFFLSDVLEPLGGYFDSDFGTSAFNERLLGEGTVNDEVWWLPLGRSTPLFYYNREIFSQVGLPDRAPKTWTEFREWGKEVNGFQYRGTPVSMRAYAGGDDWYIQGLIWNMGGAISDGLDVTLGDGPAADALEFDRAIIFDDKSGYLATDPSNDFISGLAATVTQSTGLLGSLANVADFDFGTGFLPEQKDEGVPTGGGGISIPKNASPEGKKAGFELIKYLSTGDAAVSWAMQTGYLPPTAAAAESSEMKQKTKENPNFKVALEQLGIARQPDVVRRYVPSVVPDMRTAIQKVYAGGEDPEQVIAQTTKLVETATDKIRSKYERRVQN